MSRSGKLNKGEKVLKTIRKYFLLYKDEYQKHQIKSISSYLFVHVNLLIYSFFAGNKKLVAISLIEHIGDIIATEPISREIRKKYPGAKILWFVRKPYRELLLYNPNIDKVITIYCLTTWIRIRNKHRFEAIYDLHFNGRSCNVCFRPLKKEAVDDSVNGMNYFNFGGLLKAVCIHNKIEVLDTNPQMYIPPRVIRRSEKFIPVGNYIVVHCSSNELIKDWEHDKWNQLVTILIKEYSTHIIEIGTKNNISIESIYYHNFCGKLSILQSASIIGKAKAFIGIDSGPAHMANALGTPGVVLLGEYYFGMKNYNPYSGRYGSLDGCHLVHSDSSVKNISVDNVTMNFIALLKETGLII